MKHFRYVLVLLVVLWVLTVPVTGMGAEEIGEPCIKCHLKVSPGQVADWGASKHSGIWRMAL